MYITNPYRKLRSNASLKAVALAAASDSRHAWREYRRFADEKPNSIEGVRFVNELFSFFTAKQDLAEHLGRLANLDLKTQ